MNKIHLENWYSECLLRFDFYNSPSIQLSSVHQYYCECNKDVVWVDSKWKTFRIVNEDAKHQV